MKSNGAQAPSGKRAYATVGMSRIQTYLGRSRHLWGRRGASERLAEATYLPEDHPDCLVGEVLTHHPQVEVNSEGLDIDGVVSLCTKTGDTKETGGTKEDVKAAADDLAKAIARKNPGITLTVAYTDQSDKLYAELIAQNDSEIWTREAYYSIANEFPLLRPCDECGLDPATRKVKTPDGEMRLCQDCAGRITQGDEDIRAQKKRTLDKDGSTASSKFVAERALLNELISSGELALNITREDGAKFRKSDLAVDDFKQLAKLGAHNKEADNTDKSAQDGMTSDTPAGRVRTFDSNHVALIFADGNGVGGLFKKLQEKALEEKSTRVMLDVSKKMKKHTNAALILATKAVIDADEGKCPVVPHIVGGDDILVSVSANYAWQFLLTFLQEMQEPFARLARQYEIPSHLSISAGMVICKAGFPFGNQVELAEKLLKRAKQEVRGQEWSFTWLDLTYDGADLEAHKVWQLERLENRSKQNNDGEPAAAFFPVPEAPERSELKKSEFEAIDQQFSPIIPNWREALRIARTQMSAHSESQLRLIVGQPENRDINLAHFSARMPSVREFLKECGVEDPTKITDRQAGYIEDILNMGRWWRDVEGSHSSAGGDSGNAQISKTLEEESEND